MKLLSIVHLPQDPKVAPPFAMTERLAERLEALESLVQSVVQLAEVALVEVRALRAEVAAEEFTVVEAEAAPAAECASAASAAASPVVGASTVPAGSVRNRYWLLVGIAPGSRFVGEGLYSSPRAASKALAKLPQGAALSAGVPDVEAGRRAWYEHLGADWPPLPRY